MFAMEHVLAVNPPAAVRVAVVAPSLHSPAVRLPHRWMLFWEIFVSVRMHLSRFRAASSVPTLHQSQIFRRWMTLSEAIRPPLISPLVLEAFWTSDGLISSDPLLHHHPARVDRKSTRL